MAGRVWALVYVPHEATLNPSGTISYCTAQQIISALLQSPPQRISRGAILGSIPSFKMHVTKSAWLHIGINSGFLSMPKRALTPVQRAGMNLL